MPDVFAVFSRRWKSIAAFTLVATVIASTIALVLPKKYVSTATALPASSFANDKSTIFNSNIQELYSTLGTADDLDRILGTARLDTIYIATVNTLQLASHYGLGSGPEALDAAVSKLKKNTSILKSEWGELKVKVWDEDPNSAAQIANTLLQTLQHLHQNLSNQSNQLVLQKLKEAYTIHPTDTTKKPVVATAMQSVGDPQAQVYERLMNEYSLMVATNPPVLLVVENARPAPYPDNTVKWAAVLVAFFAAALFSFLLALYAEAKKLRA